MRHTLVTICCSLLLLNSCKEKDLTVQNPPPPTDNLSWSFVPYYGGEGLDYDSVYTNDLGIDFMIDSVSLLISDISFYDENEKEFFDTVPNFILLNRRENEKLNGYLPAGGYYGQYRIILGADSAKSRKYLQQVNNVAPKFARRDGFGINFFNMKGRIFDPAEPKEDSIYIPINYTIGSYELTDTINTDRRSFSIDNSQKITIVLLGDLKPMFSSFNFNLMQEVISDPTDIQDFSAAQQLKDSLSIGIF